MKLPPKISLVSYREKCEARKLFRVLNPTFQRSPFSSLSLSFCRQKKSLLVVVVRSRGIHEPRPSVDESFSFSHESSVSSATSKFFCSYCCFCLSIESEKRPPARGRFFSFVHFVCFVFCRGRSIWCWTRKEEDAEDEDARDDDDDDDI